jgi:hypothetical protein
MLSLLVLVLVLVFDDYGRKRSESSCKEHECINEGQVSMVGGRERIGCWNEEMDKQTTTQHTTTITKSNGQPAKFAYDEVVRP